MSKKSKARQRQRNQNTNRTMAVKAQVRKNFEGTLNLMTYYAFQIHQLTQGNSAAQLDMKFPAVSDSMTITFEMVADEAPNEFTLNFSAYKTADLPQDAIQFQNLFVDHITAVLGGNEAHRVRCREALGNFMLEMFVEQANRTISLAA